MVQHDHHEFMSEEGCFELKIEPIVLWGSDRGALRRRNETCDRV